MPHVSKYPLAKDVYQEITQELSLILPSIGNENEKDRKNNVGKAPGYCQASSSRLDVDRDL